MHERNNMYKASVKSISDEEIDTPNAIDQSAGVQSKGKGYQPASQGPAHGSLGVSRIQGHSQEYFEADPGYVLMKLSHIQHKIAIERDRIANYMVMHPCSLSLPASTLDTSGSGFPADTKTARLDRELEQRLGIRQMPNGQQAQQPSTFPELIMAPKPYAANQAAHVLANPFASRPSPPGPTNFGKLHSSQMPMSLGGLYPSQRPVLPSDTLWEDFHPSSMQTRKKMLDSQISDLRATQQELRDQIAALETKIPADGRLNSMDMRLSYLEHCNLAKPRHNITAPEIASPLHDNQRPLSASEYSSWGRVARLPSPAHRSALATPSAKSASFDPYVDTRNASPPLPADESANSPRYDPRKWHPITSPAWSSRSSSHFFVHDSPTPPGRRASQFEDHREATTGQDQPKAWYRAQASRVRASVAKKSEGELPQAIDANESKKARTKSPEHGGWGNASPPKKHKRRQRGSKPDHMIPRAGHAPAKSSRTLAQRTEQQKAAGNLLMSPIQYGYGYYDNGSYATTW